MNKHFFAGLAAILNPNRTNIFRYRDIIAAIAGKAVKHLICHFILYLCSPCLPSWYSAISTLGLLDPCRIYIAQRNG